MPDARARRHGGLTFEVCEQRLASLSGEGVDDLAEWPVMEGVVGREGPRDRRIGES